MTMAIVKFDPFRGFDSIARKMNDFISGFEQGGAVDFEFGGFTPRMDINEDEKNLYIAAEIPGMNKDDVKITINDDNVLVIKGEKRTETKHNDKTHIRIERNFGSFARSFVLPENVKRDSIKAKYEKGVLELTLEKAEPQKPKEIEVSIS
jgi:HSP20 family protein